MSVQPTHVNDPKCFCYVCGHFIESTKQNKRKRTEKSKSRKLNSTFVAAFNAYFKETGITVGGKDKWWTPQQACDKCYISLTNWFKGKNRSLKFSQPAIWREPTSCNAEFGDCFFCLSKVKFKKIKVYAWSDSAIAPVDRKLGENPPVALKVKEEEKEEVEEDSETESEREDDTKDPTYEPELQCGLLGIETPVQVDKNTLDSIVIKLGLSIENAELFGSIARQFGWLKPGTITTSSDRNKRFARHYEKGKITINFEPKQIEQKSPKVHQAKTFDVVYCKNIEGLFAEFGLEHNADCWRLWMDTSANGFKAVLLHNEENSEVRHPDMIVAYSKDLPEDYDAIEQLFDLIKYRQEGHNWKICADLKMVAIVSGIKKSYCKHQCHLCDFEGRADDLHFQNYKWTPWSPKNTVVGQRSIYKQPLVMPDKIYLPDLHIKLGLMRQFVKALDKSSQAFQYLLQKFPMVNRKTISFNGPQIRQLLNDDKFLTALKTDQPDDESNVQLQAWLAFVAVCNGFIEKHRAKNYQSLVDNLLRTYSEMGCRMSLKLHFLESHLDNFPFNISAFSDQHGERFHKTIAETERRFRGKISPTFLGDHCFLTQKAPVKLLCRKVHPNRN